MVGGGRASPEQKWTPNPNHWIKRGPSGHQTGLATGHRLLAGAVCQPLSPALSPAVFGHLALCWPGQRQPEGVPGMEGQSQSCRAGRGR